MTLLLVLGGAIALTDALESRPLPAWINWIRRTPGPSSPLQRGVAGCIAAACLVTIAPIWMVGLGKAEAQDAALPGRLPTATVTGAGVPSVSASPSLEATAPPAGPTPDPTVGPTGSVKPTKTTSAPTPATTTASPVAPTLEAGATGTPDYTGPCDADTAVTFNGTAYIGPSTLRTSADIHWAFTATGDGSRTDTGTSTGTVRPDATSALALPAQAVKPAGTAAGTYTIRGTFTVDSTHTLAASPSSASVTIQITCT